MNAKTCKLLRRKARSLTIGKSETQYRRGSHPSPHNKRYIIPEGIEVAHDCTRGVYRRLKRQLQRAMQ